MSRRSITGLMVSWLLYGVIALVVAFYLGVGYLIALAALRHLLLGIPGILQKSRRLIMGEEYADRLNERLTVPEERPWPTPYWVISSLVWIGLAIVAMVKINIRLIDLLAR